MFCFINISPSLIATNKGSEISCHGEATTGDASSSLETAPRLEGEVSLLRLSLLDLLPFMDKRLIGVSLLPPPLARVPTGFLALTGLAGLGLDPNAEVSWSVCGCSCCFFCSCSLNKGKD